MGDSLTPEHISGIKQIFHYLKGMLNHSITYSESESGTNTIAYADADSVSKKTLLQGGRSGLCYRERRGKTQCSAMGRFKAGRSPAMVCVGIPVSNH